MIIQITSKIKAISAFSPITDNRTRLEHAQGRGRGAKVKAGWKKELRPNAVLEHDGDGREYLDTNVVSVAFLNSRVWTPAVLFYDSKTLAIEHHLCFARLMVF